jgi:hypothetical protein
MYHQMRALTGPDDASKFVDTGLAQGFTSFKAYADITPDELLTAITEAHARSAKVTGHLCTITFTEAAAVGQGGPRALAQRLPEDYESARSGLCLAFKICTEFVIFLHNSYTAKNRPYISR